MLGKMNVFEAVQLHVSSNKRWSLPSQTYMVDLTMYMNNGALNKLFNVNYLDARADLCSYDYC